MKNKIVPNMILYLFLTRMSIWSLLIWTQFGLPITKVRKVAFIDSVPTKGAPSYILHIK